MKKVRIYLSFFFCLFVSSTLLAQKFNVNYVMKSIRKPKRDLVTVFAHRGYWQENGVPENSLKAIRRAEEEGIEAVELDIKVSRNGVPFLMHDYAMNRTTTQPRGRVSDYTSGELNRIHLKDKNGRWNAETVPSLEQALDYIRDNRLSVVVALDIKSLSDAQVCWSIVKRKRNWWGTPAYDWVIFKLSAQIFASGPARIEEWLDLDRFQIPQFKLMPYFTTSQTDQFNCIRLFNDTKNKPYFVGVEPNLKHNGGFLSDIVNQAKRDGKALGCFNPISEAGTGFFPNRNCNPTPGRPVQCTSSGYNSCYWVDGGYCRYQLRDVLFYSTKGRGRDLTDNRWDWDWLLSWGITFVTTDNPVNMRNFLAKRGKRNLWSYYNDSRRIGSDELASDGALTVYPNPTAGNLTVNFTQENTGAVQFNVVDITGKLVFTQQQNVEEGEQEVVLADLKAKGVKPGVYFLQVTPADVRRRKIVKIVVE